MISSSPITGDKGLRPTTEGDRFTVAQTWFAYEAGGMPSIGYPLATKFEVGVKQARLYDEAMGEYPGFIASRRNYDVGQGIDDKGQRRSGVLKSSWRVGGATAAELAALTRFAEDPSVQIVEASHLEKFGPDRDPPPGALVHFQGEDPEVGPLLRYTVVGRIARSKGGET